MSTNTELTTYENLPPFEKNIVYILSIIYTPIAATLLKDCLAAAGVKTNKGLRFDDSYKYRSLMLNELRPTVDMLEKAGIIQKREYGRLTLKPAIAEIAIRQTVKEKRFNSFLKAIETKIDLMNGEKMDLVAAVRILFYQKKMDDILDYYNQHKDQIYDAESLSKIMNIIFHSFDPDWFQLISGPLLTEMMRDPFVDDITKWQNNANHFEYAEELVAAHSNRCEPQLQALVLDFWFMIGNTDAIKKWLKNHPAKDSENSLCAKACLAFFEGKNKKAMTAYEKALPLIQTKTKKSPRVFNHLMGVFYVLALFKDSGKKSLENADRYIRQGAKSKTIYKSIYETLGYVLEYLHGNLDGASVLFRETYISSYISERDNCLDLFFELFAYYWIDQEESKETMSAIKSLYKIAKTNSYAWFQHELGALLNDLNPKKKVLYKDASPLLRDLLKKSSVWEISLDALLGIKHKAPQEAVKEYDSRMVWFIDFTDGGSCHAKPREQKRQANGKWTKGRPIALKRLSESLSSFPYLTRQDKEICSHIYEHSYASGRYTNYEYLFDDKYIFSLIGHPLLFLDDGITQVELTTGKPELVVQTKENNDISIELRPKPSSTFTRDYYTLQETPTRLKIIRTSDEFQRIAKIIGKGLVVPSSAKRKVQEAIDRLAGDITILSDFSGKSNECERVASESIIHAHLIPSGMGLKLSVFVKPFGSSGAYYKPGTGGINVFADIGGKKLQTARDLQKEISQLDTLIQHCPILQVVEDNNGEWLIDHPEDCLELLTQLEAVRDQIVLEWPEGQKFKLLGDASIKQLQIKIQAQNDWFAASGQLRIDKKLVIEMTDLLASLSKNSSRFVEIKDGQFIALTQEFSRRLRELNRYSEPFAKGVRFHPLSVLALEGLLSEVGQLKSDRAWKEHMMHIENVQDIQPQLPPTLKAELRDYQRQGYNWLFRLSYWKFGACLADDMGLGKTVQALAMLLYHSLNGKCLVIAPTSVCSNWIDEARRFAPTLQMVSLGQTKRQQTLDKAGKYHVVVCSYGLLQQKQVAAMLSEASWEMVILDEAQAIKNYFTKRSQAAMKLKARFKLITTGTPIENHLGELWNLFQFINPGLLGTLDSFNQKFAIPIEKHQDRQARRDLKKLIQPFMLRRTKNQVLEELPTRTEIRLEIELSKEEMAFYEALRQQALAELSKVKDNKAGQKHLKILAQIMKLRRACCNSQLVNDDIEIPSSKLEVFGNVLQELLENKHKALVFSQFVDHLSIVRTYLDTHQIAYQYLDGSTSTKNRKIAVDAFQAGEGDVFLISLKAGGMGLNLTAADYVIHLDPWWNPAVEDQAADRAHRIGQVRPVTIYRLVTKDTIEEKIVQMHQTKRNLADSLLQGADMTGKMTGKELLDLIRN
jgi:SNF2 family DNA or RNA helicase